MKKQIVIFIVLTTICSSLCSCGERNPNASISMPPYSTADSEPTTSLFSVQEQEALLYDLISSIPDHQLVKYTVGTKESYVTIAAIYHDTKTDSETGFAFRTSDGGAGYLNLNTENMSLSLNSAYGLFIQSTDTSDSVHFSLIDSESSNTLFYEILIFPDLEGVHCTVTYRDGTSIDCNSTPSKAETAT